MNATVMPYGVKHTYEGKDSCFCTQLIAVGNLKPRFCGQFRNDPIHKEKEMAHAFEETHGTSRFDRAHMNLPQTSVQKAASEYLEKDTKGEKVCGDQAILIQETETQASTGLRITESDYNGGNELKGQKAESTGSLYGKGDWKDLTPEYWREYVYPDGSVYRINRPQAVSIEKKESGDRHRVVFLGTHDCGPDRELGTYVKPGWIAVRWEAAPGCPVFTF